MNYFKTHKIIALFLAVLMILPLIPAVDLTVFAEGTMAVTTESLQDDIGRTATIKDRYFATYPDACFGNDVLFVNEGKEYSSDILFVIDDAKVAEGAVFYKLRVISGSLIPPKMADYPWICYCYLDLPDQTSLILGDKYAPDAPDDTDKEDVSIESLPSNVSLNYSYISDEIKLSAVWNSLALIDGFVPVKHIGLNITPIDANGNKWQPSSGSSVIVRVKVDLALEERINEIRVLHILDSADAVSAALANGTLMQSTDSALISIYSEEAKLMNGAVPYVMLSTEDNTIIVNEDGSIAFSTDSFSDYYIVLGFTEGLSLSNRGNDTYYVEPGTTLTFNRDATWSAQGMVPEGISASGNKITIGNNVTIPAEVTYDATWSRGYATITVKVTTRKEVVSGLIDNESYPVILSVVQNRTSIPSEPGLTEGKYYNFNSNYTIGGGGIYPPEFSSTAEGIIDSSISDVLVSSIDGENVIGFSDSTGKVLSTYISGIDFDRIMTVAVNQKWKAINGTTITNANKNEYQIVPYVVKLMDGANYSGKGWHIDCAIVPKSTVTLSYDINLDNYVVTGTIKLPNASTDIPTFNATAGYIQYRSNNLAVGGTVSATYGDTQYNLTFQGWNTKPDGSGQMYSPNGSVSVSEDMTLYAIWTGAVVPGNLYIYKDVAKDVEDITLPDGYENIDFEFRVKLEGNGLAGSYNYVVYGLDSNGNTIQIGATQTLTLNNNVGVIKLKHKQYAIIANIPANTSYSITEIPVEYYTQSATGDTGSIRSGGNSIARYINIYSIPQITINYVAVGGGTVDRQTETIYMITNAANGSTATPNAGYEFIGWYLDSECKNPVNISYADLSGAKQQIIKPTVTQHLDEFLNGITFYAHFEEIEVTINYVAVGPEGATNYGSVNPTSDSVGAVSGNPSSTATPNAPTFKFVGWFDKDDKKLSDSLTYEPQRVNGLHVAATYYAKFEYNLTSLTITKTGWNSVDPNQTFIFNVSGGGVNVDVTIHGNGSVTIYGLTVGQSYTITEKTNWSWRYECTEAGYTGDNAGTPNEFIKNTATLYIKALGVSNNVATFTNNRKNEYWLDGDSWCDNRFMANVTQAIN